MNPVDLIASVLQMVSGIPAVGHYAVIVLSAIVGLGALVTAAVGLWHSVVMFVGALSHIQGLNGLSGVAESLKANEASVSDFANNKILPVLNRLSLIPLPQAAK